MRNFKLNFEQEEITYEIELLERQARGATSKTILHNMAKEYFNNAAICRIIAENRYISNETIEMLAMHPDHIVRLRIAEKSNLITNKKILIQLTFDWYIPVRRALSRSTTVEGIKRLLLKGNLNDRKIVGNCLRRSKDMELIQNFILDASEEQIESYAKDILCNKNLTELEVKTLLITCSKISDFSIPKLIAYVHAIGPVPECIIHIVDNCIDEII